MGEAALFKAAGEKITVADVENYLDSSLTAVAEFVAGAASDGNKGLVVMGAKVFQAAMKGRMLKELRDQIHERRDKGRIAENFADEEYGAESFAELMDFIDSPAPDPERLKAMKAIFFALNDPKFSGKTRKLLAFRFMKLTRVLTGPQIVLLGHLWVMKQKIPNHPNNNLRNQVATDLYANISTVAQLDLEALGEHKLISINSSIIQHVITDYGVAYCEFIQEYGEPAPTMPE